MFYIVLLSIMMAPSVIRAFTVPSHVESVKDTRVEVGHRSRARVALDRSPKANVTLSQYMRLPVEQYVLIKLPLDSELTKLDAGSGVDVPEMESDNNTGLFKLLVPPITFTNLTLQPVVFAAVECRKNEVVIHSHTCVLQGSEFIERTRLNERFDFKVETSLTWEDNMDSDSFIYANTRIEVDVDVPRPFNRIPKLILQRIGNAAVKISLKVIQGTFVENLASDYSKWSQDEPYRLYRASLSQRA
mmetsp:Transcript_37590/g.90002  ORF Transcript_37590/g.90002 Transcript_37590/m.90002 type:complete len:245 (+) Transcript_37590:280-1014(+)